MPVLLAQVVWDSDSALPRDAVTGTFHWNLTGGPPTTTQTDEIRDALVAFYTGLAAGQTLQLDRYMSSELATTGRLNIYDLSDPEPRVPVATYPLTKGQPVTGTPLPSECAAVISWTATPVAGVSPARLRGRTYIGPLQNTTTVTDPSQGVVFLSAAFRADLAAAALGLINASSIFELTYVIYSARARDNSNPAIPYEDRPILAPLASLITGGFVDNAFDTQRRRGHRPSLRSTF